MDVRTCMLSCAETAQATISVLLSVLAAYQPLTGLPWSTTDIVSDPATSYRVFTAAGERASKAQKQYALFLSTVVRNFMAVTRLSDFAFGFVLLN